MIPKLWVWLVLVGIVAFISAAFFPNRAHAATLPVARLSASPLGVNVSPRVNISAAAQARVNAQLKVLGPVAVRYGGGTLADTYFWSVNKDTYDCADKYTPDPSRSCARQDSLSLPGEAANPGVNIMPIINYGSSTAQYAAAWAKTFKAEHVTSVELSNEPYGCGSDIYELTMPPVVSANYQRGVPSTCPYTLYGSVAAGITKMGQSYNVHAPAFVSALKAADPGLRVQFAYAISPPGNSGYAWNRTVMASPAFKSSYAGLVVLWYPHYSVPVVSDRATMGSLAGIPAAAGRIKADIARYAPGKSWQIGETNISNLNNTTTCRPAGAVFAAGAALSWLAQGASNVNWWDETDPVNSGGHCIKNDFAMFDNTGVAQPPYWGYLLASKLAVPGAILRQLGGTSSILVFQSKTVTRHTVYAYINLSTTAVQVVADPFKGLRAQTWGYFAKVPKVKTAITVQPKTAKLPAESITVFAR